MRRSARAAYAGTAFSNLTFLSYKTFQRAAGTNATTLQFDGDFDSTDANTTFQGRVSVRAERVGWSNGAARGLADVEPDDRTVRMVDRRTRASIVGGVSAALAVPAVGALFVPAVDDRVSRIWRSAGITGQNAGVPTAGGIWLKAGSGWASRSSATSTR